MLLYLDPFSSPNLKTNRCLAISTQELAIASRWELSGSLVMLQSIYTKTFLQNIIGGRWSTREIVPSRPFGILWLTWINLSSRINPQVPGSSFIVWYWLMVLASPSSSPASSDSSCCGWSAWIPVHPQVEWRQSSSYPEQLCCCGSRPQRHALFRSRELWHYNTKPNQDKNEKRKKFRHIRQRVKTIDMCKAEQRVVNSR